MRKILKGEDRRFKLGEFCLGLQFDFRHETIISNDKTKNPPKKKWSSMVPPPRNSRFSCWAVFFSRKKIHGIHGISPTFNSARIFWGTGAGPMLPPLQGLDTVPTSWKMGGFYMVLFGGHQGRKAAGWINPKENEHGEPLVNHNISYRKYTSSFMVDVLLSCYFSGGVTSTRIRRWWCSFLL